MRQAPVESWLSRLLARMLANSALAGAKTRKFRTRLGWQLDFSRVMKVLAYIIGHKTDFCRWSELLPTQSRHPTIGIGTSATFFWENRPPRADG